jgi:hypothetical protein
MSQAPPDNTSRRSFLGVIAGTGLTVGLAGCTGSSRSFESSPAQYSPQVVEETPYTAMSKERIETTELLQEVTDIETEVSADSYLVNYVHNSLPQGAVVASTPSVSVGGTELNPLAGNIEDVMDMAIRAANNRSDQTSLMVQDYEQIDEVDLETTLGTETARLYEIIAQSEEYGELTLEALITVHTNEDSVILTVGAILTDVEEAPESFQQRLEESRDEEYRTLQELLENVEHPVEWDDISVENE